MNEADVEELLISLERIADALEVIAGDPCEACGRIHPDDAYQYVCENPPERGI